MEEIINMVIQCKAVDGLTYSIEIDATSPLRNTVTVIPPQEEGASPQIMFQIPTVTEDGNTVLGVATQDDLPVGKHLFVMTNPLIWNVGPEVFIWGGVEKGLVPVTNVLDYGLFGGYLIQDDIVMKYHAFIEKNGHLPLICELDTTKCQRKNGFSSVQNGSSIVVPDGVLTFPQR